MANELIRIRFANRKMTILVIAISNNAPITIPAMPPIENDDKIFMVFNIVNNLIVVVVDGASLMEIVGIVGT